MGRLRPFRSAGTKPGTRIRLSSLSRDEPSLALTRASARIDGCAALVRGVHSTIETVEEEMVDIQQKDVDLQQSNPPGALLDWRRVLLGWGFLLLIAALFAGARTNSGVASKLISVAGLLMITVSTVALIANWLGSRA